MNQTQLLRCIESLKAVRSLVHDELDPSIAAELDAVITKLRLHEAGGLDLDAARDALDEGLDILARIIASAASIADLISRVWR